MHEQYGRSAMPVAFYVKRARADWHPQQISVDGKLSG
jgi:hypothetical protein